MQPLGSLMPIPELITQSLSHYATVNPKGILLPHATAPLNPLIATIITYHPARTRYRNRRPVCRSLDGLRCIGQHKLCVACDDARACTPQIVLHLLYKTLPCKLLLSYTSARNFLCFTKAATHPPSLLNSLVTITTIDRGHWGELRFKANA